MFEYVEWLKEQDEHLDHCATEFWENEITNVSSAPQLPWDQSMLSALRPEKEKPLEIERVSVPLTVSELKSMEGAAALYGVSLDTLVQGAWALILGVYQGTDEVVLGITSSGRSNYLGLIR